MVRKNDFRASGSGEERTEKELISDEVLKLSFEITEMLQAQCLVFDFVLLKDKPLVVEISYGTTVGRYHTYPGYFDKDLNWYDGVLDFGKIMVEEVLGDLRDRK